MTRQFTGRFAGRIPPASVRRLLKLNGIFVSSDLGPWSQNLLLSLVTQLLRGKKVRLPFHSMTSDGRYHER